MSHADELFIKNVKAILSEGVSEVDQAVRPHWADGTPAHTIALFGVCDRYDLAEEFPIVTLRRQYWKSALDEVLWIWQKKSNNVRDLNSHVWDEWADESGSIGKAYGYQMGKLSKYRDVTAEGLRKAFGDTPEGKKICFGEDGVCLMDQTDRVIYQLVNDPASRRIMTNMYCIEDLSEMALYPCAYSMTFTVIGGRLNAILNQRSQDMLTANSWNTIQAALIVYALASAYGFVPGELVHMIANCHIYDRHVDIMKKLIEQPLHEAPKLYVNPEIRDFYEFTTGDFRLENYQYNEFREEIEIAI